MKLLTILLVLLSISASAYSQTTYTWTGSVNSGFSTAGNWSPIRQVGLTSDILVFSNGGNLNVNGVNQITIGQLIIRNNTNLTLIPSTGNSKTISINGAAGDDFVIESGSSLNISASNPQLNILVKTGANAVINGELDFSGSASNNLNAVDSLSIRFGNGSVLNQMCPGNIFTTAGVNNAVVFENGSTFKLNNLSALNPFGFSAPGSKVRFRPGSSFDLCVSNSAALSLSGRTYSNMVIESNVYVNNYENYSSALNIDNLTVNSSSALVLNNLNQNVCDINLKGDLTVDGYICFSDTTSNIRNLVLNFTGNSNHSIYGSGQISFTKLLRLGILNDITLYRDLLVNCPALIYGVINRNGHNFLYTSIGISSSSNGNLSDRSNNNNNSNTPASKNDNAGEVPSSFSVSQNYPNPFNPSTKIDYQLAADSKVSIKIYDINGKEVATVVDNNQNAGNYTTSFDGSKLSSGAYFYRITASGNGHNFTDVKKMMIVK